MRNVNAFCSTQSDYLILSFIKFKTKYNPKEHNYKIPSVHAASLIRYPFGRAGTHVVHQKRGLNVDFELRKTIKVFNPDVKK